MTATTLICVADGRSVRSARSGTAQLWFSEVSASEGSGHKVFRAREEGDLSKKIHFYINVYQKKLPFMKSVNNQ